MISLKLICEKTLGLRTLGGPRSTAEIYKTSKKYSKYVSRDYGQNFYYLIDFIRHENTCTCTFMFIIENKKHL